jgi:hypothetical protein
MNKAFSFRHFPLVFFALIAFLFSSCFLSGTFKREEALTDKLLDSLPKNYQPVWGDRFMLTGNFDKKPGLDTLVEEFLDERTNAECNKYWDSTLTYDQAVGLAYRRSVKVSLKWMGDKNARFTISQSHPTFGLFYLANEGDLNGDGCDEISYLCDWADFSSLNTLFVISYDGKKWKKLFSFETREWVFDECFGSLQTISLIPKGNFDYFELKTKQDLLKMIKPGEVSVKTFSNEAIDTNLIIRFRL